MRSRHAIALLVFLLCGAALAGPDRAGGAPPSSPPGGAAASPPPDFTLPALDGQPVALNQFLGKKGVSPTLEEEAMIELVGSGVCQQLTIIIPRQLGSVFSFDHRYSLFFRPGQFIDLPELRKLLDWRSAFQNLPLVHPDLALARLLGYSDQESFAFTYGYCAPLCVLSMLTSHRQSIDGHCTGFDATWWAIGAI